jgi:hypothetical protein
MPESALICPWNGEGGDGPGGSRRVMEEARNHGGRTVWLDTTNSGVEPAAGERAAFGWRRAGRGTASATIGLL